MNLNKVIAERFADALTAIGVDPEPYLGLVRPSQDPKFGDFQANFAMPLGKRLGKAPRDVAVIQNNPTAFLVPLDAATGVSKFLFKKVVDIVAN